MLCIGASRVDEGLSRSISIDNEGGLVCHRAYRFFAFLSPMLSMLTYFLLGPNSHIVLLRIQVKPPFHIALALEKGKALPVHASGQILQIFSEARCSQMWLTHRSLINSFDNVDETISHPWRKSRGLCVQNVAACEVSDALL